MTYDASATPSAGQVCPVCQVTIMPDGKVLFSSGSPGTRARLHARVCQYTQKPGCINQDADLIGEVRRNDTFESGENLVPDLSSPPEMPGSAG